MTGMAQEPVGTGATRWKRLAVPGGALLVGGILGLLVAAVIAGATMFSGLLSAVGQPTRTTPVDQQVQMTAGRWLVYQWVAPSRTAATDTPGFPTTPPAPTWTTTLQPADVEVRASDGSAARVAPAASSDQIDVGSGVFLAAVEIRVPADGVYRVRITPGTPTRVIVGPSVETSLSRLATRPSAWTWSVAGCLTAFVVGAALLGVGLSRRPRRPGVLPGGVAVPYPVPGTATGVWPPGWYPDPWRPGGHRYWDGRGWTGHQA